MRYLRRLYGILPELFHRGSEAGISDQVDLGELLARYLFRKSHYSTKYDYVKSSAFIPPDDRKLSVFRISGLSEDGIWKLGQEKVAEPSERTLRGRADLAVLAVHDAELEVEPDDDPVRHANVVGWPEKKDRQKLKAAKLAASASLHLRTLDS